MFRSSRLTKLAVAFTLTLAPMLPLAAQGLTWHEGEPTPPGGIADPFPESPQSLPQRQQAGQMHALVYPVTVTGALLPYESIRGFLSDPADNPLRAVAKGLSQAFSGIKSFDDAMAWLGLQVYPEHSGEAGEFPLPPGMKPGDRIGLSLLTTADGTKGFTISCAACHVGQLFGRPVIGLTNRFPRANAFFIRGKALTEMVASPVFKAATGATEAERQLYRRTRHNMYYVGSKRPETLGLDTSLAHVALSLARRAPNEFADKDLSYAAEPRDEILATLPADSKPAVWWNARYKNRWLADGSVVSGNPIVTNLLWNEIGRGTDLRELEEWLQQNQKVVEELTTAVFTSSPPPITEFFPAEKWSLSQVQAGQRVYSAHCAKCHGDYVKRYQQPGWESLPLAEQLRTTEVNYLSQTPVRNVGTDETRWRGMNSLAQLNNLKISKDNGVTIRPQAGYVPPPLVGIWARWPYFHNNSAPSLCAVLTPGPQRPETYWAGEAVDREADFDLECNGYPLGERVPPGWREDRAKYFDSRRAGLSRLGHDERILVRDGRLVLNDHERRQLIQFLQTL